MQPGEIAKTDGVCSMEARDLGDQIGDSKTVHCSSNMLLAGSFRHHRGETISKRDSFRGGQRGGQTSLYKVFHQQVAVALSEG